MTVREISLGIPGLDRVLGGPLRLVERLANQPSTSVLVRGGPGTGKTSLALHLAADIAKQLDGDVLFASVEMVASELRAIYDGTSGEDRLGKQVVDLAKPAADVAEPDGSHATVWFANLDVVGRSGPEVHAALETSFVELLRSARSSTSRGVRAVVVDGLSDGYDLGSKAPRALADGLVKFAAQEGFVLVLVEETSTTDLTHWSFAVDVCLLLMSEPGLPPGTRHLQVVKTRFSATTAGPHLYTMGQSGASLAPHPASYLLRRATNAGRFLRDSVAAIWEPGQPVRLAARRKPRGGAIIDLGSPNNTADKPGSPRFGWDFSHPPAMLLAKASGFLAKHRGLVVTVGDFGAFDAVDPTLRDAHLSALAALVFSHPDQDQSIMLEDSSVTGLSRAIAGKYEMT